MTKHLLDAPGDYCRYPEWDYGGTRLTVCANPGYPYCSKHQLLVTSRRAEREAGRTINPDRVVIWGRP